MKTFIIIITGVVQGVGFRPFIYNLAKELNLSGTISNTTEGVLITANFKSLKSLRNFLKRIKKEKPGPSVIENTGYREIPFKHFNDFMIEPSKETSEKFQLVSPDLATCNLCIKDIFNRQNKRRYHYPFTNCTNCGPRFTIIKALPYDRSNTTMSAFHMCYDCNKEYQNPQNRRFHAQPNACSKCGPKLILVNSMGIKIDENNPVKTASDKLAEGNIVGIKSLGGFQIACDAGNDDIVRLLRKRKGRPSKPFALMFKSIEDIKKYYKVTKLEEKALQSVAAPIVLLKKRKKIKNNLNKIAESISFNNKFEGIMLPYTPLHHILFDYFKNPLVMTSGNLTEEPITSDNEEAVNKLGSVCDYFLLHDRPVYSRYDDSLVKIFNRKIMILRRARGFAPYPVRLKEDAGLKTILSLGAQEKSTFCILKNQYGILSQHLGDMDNLESTGFFKETLKIYRNLFNINKPDIIAIDKHPGYFTSKYGKKISQNEKVLLLPVQHHKAHAASVIAENRLYGKKIAAFSWDGTGYGDDKKIWGSEVFYINENLEFKRVGHLIEKILPGGEASINNPYRMALTYIYYLCKKKEESFIFENYVYENFKHFGFVSKEELKIITFQINKGFNSIYTTSMGRFFDAISSMLNIKHRATYEGEAAISLEMIIKNNSDDSYKINDLFLSGNKNDKYIIDDIALFAIMAEDFFAGTTPELIALKFHNTLANIILEISKRMRYFYGTEIIALSGGVFQNHFLLEKTFKLLKKNDFQVFTNFQVPVNDGGISLGQAVIALKKKI